MHHCIPEGIILPGRPGQGRSWHCFLLFSYVTARFWVVPRGSCSKLMQTLLIFWCDWFCVKITQRNIPKWEQHLDSGKLLQPKGQMVGEASELYSNLLLFTSSRLIFIFFKTCTQWTSIHYFLFLFFLCNCSRICHIRQPPIVLKALNLSLPAFADGYGGGEWSGQLSCGGWWRPCRRKIPLFTVRNASLTRIWSFHVREEEKKKSPHYSLFYCVRGSVCGGEHFPSKGCFETNLSNTQNKTMHAAFPRKGAAFLLWATGHLLSPGSVNLAQLMCVFSCVHSCRYMRCQNKTLLWDGTLRALEQLTALWALSLALRVPPTST